MSEYYTTIGLEVHAELKTRTKMFCHSKNDTEEKRPNVNICPVCMGYPGTLPVINKEAVRHVLRFGLAVGGELADYTEFDRKNYFYPDIPKGYQISQYKYPLVKGGELKGVTLTRVHLEEDTAKSSHESTDGSLVDFNRAGVPLMELVTEPVITSAEQAADFARELQLLLVYLGASDANLEKGEMRVEANISVSKDKHKFGTKVEVKNLNSFKAVEKAINFEVARHIELLENGGEVIQETRGWDENKAQTFSQRVKEDSHDYRYFPDPDLPKLFISTAPDFSEKVLRSTLPELPDVKRERFASMYTIKPESIEIFVREAVWGRFFEEVVADDHTIAELASNYITSDLASLLKENGVTPYETKMTAFAMRELMRMTSRGDISSRGAKDILKILVEEGGDPKRIAEEKDLIQKSDIENLKIIVQEIIIANDAAVNEYKAGKEASLQFLIGQGMKKTKGSGNPKVLKELFENELKK